jgi:hypothetical protein
MGALIIADFNEFGKWMVGASGFEPPTSWSRTMGLENLTALFGVAYTEKQLKSRSLKYPEVVPKPAFPDLKEKGRVCTIPVQSLQSEYPAVSRDPARHPYASTRSIRSPRLGF